MNGQRIASMGKQSKYNVKNAALPVVKREVELDGSCNVCGGTHFGDYHCPYKPDASKGCSVVADGRETLRHNQPYVKGGEPDITINGHVLTPAQAATVRCAIEVFASMASDPEVGAIGPVYLERIREIRRMMYQETR
jgi:hypothetical protein